ncbi:MAG: hypothetical protein HYV42_00580 [Candidatus Magasanikbacteria bacterium]|nr:hypothetical protein [Candidatus Magasanikbacteria bacterium]
MYPTITKTVTPYQQLIKKLQRLDLDVTAVLALPKKQDIWRRIRGVLPKRPSGLTVQQRLRKEWV